VNAVVERCPNCGVEHEVSHTGPCEVCGSELRYWCQRHSRDTGWLSGVQCPLCLREAELRAAAPPPAPPRVELRRPAPAAPVPRGARPPRHREPRPIPRVDAREILPHVAIGARLTIRALHAVVVLVRTVFLWAFLGAAAGAGYAYMTGDDMVWIAIFGLTNGAVVGFFLGLLLALRALLARRS
jgi:hypothetical protein